MGSHPSRPSPRWKRSGRGFVLASITTAAAMLMLCTSPATALQRDVAVDSTFASGAQPGSTGVRSLPFPRLANIFLLGAVDDVDIVALARWDLLVLNAVWTEAQLARLRALNPDIQLLMYVCPYAVPRSPYAPNTFETDLHRYATTHDLWWYSTRGTPASDWPNTAMVNLTASAPAAPEGAWRDWLAGRITRQMEAVPQWDGVFLDNYWRQLSWAQPWLQLDSDCNPTHSPHGCNGVADAPADLDAAWNTTLRRFARRLRADLDRLGRKRGKAYALHSNGASDFFEALNGTMIENFPRGVSEPGNPHGYGWNRWMLQSRVGYLTPLYTGRPYSAGILNAGWPGTMTSPQRSDDFERHKRFTLASALLGDGFYSLDRAPSTHAALWWEPEYAPPGATNGYLGMARGGAKRVGAAAGIDLLPNGGFEAPFRSPWSFQGPAGLAGLQLDATQFSGGAPSARIDIAAGADPGTVKLAVHPVPVEAQRTYTLRFAARATTAQEITVHLYSEACPNVRCLSSTRFWVGKNWQRFEYAFTATGSADAGLDFFFGNRGSVWLDEISLRAGDSSVFRRDFDAGIVVVNATNATVTVPLGAIFERLHVAGDELYDGARVASETLGPWDARILLRTRSPRKSVPLPAGELLTIESPQQARDVVALRIEVTTTASSSLDVYDVAGRHVRRIDAWTLVPGVHRRSWNRCDAQGRRVASGVYFMTLVVEGRHTSRKLVVVD